MKEWFSTLERYTYDEDNLEGPQLIVFVASKGWLRGQANVEVYFGTSRKTSSFHRC